MKKKGMAIGALLMAVAITGYSVSGTYAKYISAVDITDEARVAKWDINLMEGTKKLENNHRIDLFQESYTNAGNKYVQSLGCTTTDVDGTDVTTCDRVVAPGTEGSYTFTIEGQTETNYTLNVNLLNTSANTVRLIGTDGTTVEYDPIRFSLDGTTWFGYDDLATKINEQFKDKVYGPNAAVNETVSIQWKWAFDATEATAIGATSDDAKDTKLGNEIAADATSHTIKLDLKVTAEQTKNAVTP